MARRSVGLPASRPTDLVTKADLDALSTGGAGVAPLLISNNVLRRWLTRRFVRPFNIYTFGDSRPEGVSSSAAQGMGAPSWGAVWPNLLARNLDAATGMTSGGRGWLMMQLTDAPTNYRFALSRVIAGGYSGARDDTGVPGSQFMTPVATGGQRIRLFTDNSATSVDFYSTLPTGVTSYILRFRTSRGVVRDVSFTNTPRTSVTRITAPGDWIEVETISNGVFVLGAMEYVNDENSGIRSITLPVSGGTALTQSPIMNKPGLTDLRTLLPPSMTIISYGANELASGYPVQSMVNNMNAIRTAMGVPTLISTVVGFGNLATPAIPYNNAIRSLGAEGVMDPAIYNGASADPDMIDWFSSDGVHYSETAHVANADIAFDVLMGPQATAFSPDGLRTSFDTRYGRSTITVDTDGKPLVQSNGGGVGLPALRTIKDRHPKTQCNGAKYTGLTSIVLDNSAPGYPAQMTKTWDVAERDGYALYAGARGLTASAASPAIGVNIIDGSGCTDSYDFRTIYTGDRMALHLYVIEGGDIQVFINKQPVTDYSMVVPFVGDNSAFLKLQWPTFGTYEVEVTIGRGIGLVQAIYPNGQGGLMAPTPQAKWAIVGDSWTTGQYGTATIPKNVFGGSFPMWLKHVLGVDLYMLGQGGTGYINNPGSVNGINYGAYGDQSRRDARIAVANDCEALVVFGCGNDSARTFAEIQAAASAYYTQLATDHPNLPIIVFGAQPGQFVGAQFTVPNMENANAAVKSAALAATNVKAFIDMRDPKVPLVYGTGYAGNEKNDGKADYFISNDAIHPSERGHRELGVWAAERLGGVLI